MTKDDELIRRGDAMEAVQTTDFRHYALGAIAAFPAAPTPPEVVALVEAAKTAANDLDGYVGQGYGDYLRTALAAWEARNDR